MAPILPIRLTELKRQTLSTVLFVVMLICASFGLILVIGGVFIKVHIKNKMNLIQGYNSNTLLFMLVCVGLCLTIIDTIGGKLCYDVADPSRRKSLQSVLMLFICFFMLLNLAVLAASIMCFVHQILLRDSFHFGLMDAMIRYSDNDTIKFEIDFLQMEFQCCGNDGYEDWFEIQWINNAYLNLDDLRVEKKMTDGLYLNDDVPFSCCDPFSWRPCIHHHVHDNKLHFNYDFHNGVTLYTIGCKYRLMEFFGQKLQLVGFMVTAICVIQVIVFFGLRYLQTSIESALKTGDPEATSFGSIWDGGPPKQAPDGESGVGLLGEESDFTDSTFDDDFSDDDDEINQGFSGGQNGPRYENLPIDSSVDEGPEMAEGDAPSKDKKDKKKDKKKSSKGSKKASSKKQSPKSQSPKTQSAKKQSTKNNKKASPKSSPSSSKKASTKNKAAPAKPKAKKKKKKGGKKR